MNLMLYLRNMRSFNQIAPILSPAPPPAATYTLEFHGKTPARLRAVYDRLFFGGAPPPPAEIELDAAFPNTIQRDGSVREDYAQMALASAQSMEEEIVERTSSTRCYFLIAKVVFDDIFGQQHEFGFCYNALMRGGVGNTHGGTAYNYRRIRSPNERI
jgi:hypothetical protein